MTAFPRATIARSKRQAAVAEHRGRRVAAEREPCLSPGPYRILFLCTGNSARSIIAEAIVNELGGDRCNARSAGSHPTGQVNPGAIRLLDELGFDSSTLRSKSWDVFAGAGAPSFDLVVTVCDNAAEETCPVWPGQPLTAHWSIADPAAASGAEDEVRQAFMDAYEALAARIQEILALPLESMKRTELRAALRARGAAR